MGVRPEEPFISLGFSLYFATISLIVDRSSSVLACISCDSISAAADCTLSDLSCFEFASLKFNCRCHKFLSCKKYTA